MMGTENTLSFIRQDEETDEQLSARVRSAGKTFFRCRILQVGTVDPGAVARGFTLEITNSPLGKTYRYTYEHSS